MESLNLGRKKGEKKPPIANAFALGYTYLDVLDTDQEGSYLPHTGFPEETWLLTIVLSCGIDVVARLGLYLVSKPEPAFMPIFKSLFTAATIPDTLIVILLDWRKPWDWMRQLRTWVRLLGALFRSLGDDARRALDDVTQTCTSPSITEEGT